MGDYSQAPVSNVFWPGDGWKCASMAYRSAPVIIIGTLYAGKADLKSFNVISG